MTRRGRTAAFAAAALAVVAGTSLAVGASPAGPGPEDDLTVVKRAVAQSSSPAVVRTPEPPRSTSAADRPARAAGKDPTWLKVRVTDKVTGKRKVTVNLPFALVRAVGDNWPRVEFGCGDDRHTRCGIKIADVLAALEAGQDLVEVDDENETVRVWVE
jgi:hypothetical protein